MNKKSIFNKNFKVILLSLISFFIIGGCGGNSASVVVTSNSCTHDGVSIPNGSSSNFYSSSQVPNGSSCVAGVVKCNGGVVSNGEQFPFSTCSVANSLNTCTQDPKLFMGSNYRQRIGALTITSSILVKINSADGTSSNIDLSESLNAVSGQPFGFIFRDINVLSNEDPVVAALESGYTFRGSDCYPKSFYWEKTSNPYLDYTEFLFPSVSPITEQFMFNDMSRGSNLVVSNDVVLNNFNYAAVPPNPTQGLCPLRSPVTRLTGVHNLNTDVRTYYSQPLAVSYSVNSISKLNSDIYAVGTEDFKPVYWKNGSIFNLPNPDNHRISTFKSDTSRGSVYFATVDSEGVNRNKLLIWKNGALFKNLSIPDDESLIDFYTDGGNRYSFIQFSNRVNPGPITYYYLKNESQRTNIDLSLYNQCRGLNMHVLNNKVFVSAHCSLPGSAVYNRHVVWIDGVHQYSLNVFTSVPNASDSELKVGCQTASGFKTKLD